eukprot:CAMPEP_0170453686 /NCGR_PEP_ID=MMETSP0123-20130129/2197_1 /TAXON_ID=182087 /ORGANISM="Favella ehrenbergii, Strain Fehren 1" /LENGTH=135 /DNA_ID=CAMNT_0010716165 /DNA_START=434 /DNA_END=838 /DNA_ORIENTATION=+
MIKDTSVFTVAGRRNERLADDFVRLFGSAKERARGRSSNRDSLEASDLHARQTEPPVYAHTHDAGGQARTVRIFSNKPEHIFREEALAAQPVRLLPNSIHPISVFAKFEKPEILLTPSLVNAVDIDSGELVYSWL